MTNYFKTQLLLILLLLSNSVLAQFSIVEKPQLTSANGLPQSFISGIVQDGTGFIWLSTRDGLARYDGRRFKVFRHYIKNPKSLASNIIVGVYLDGEDQLWIHHENGEIDILNTKSERLYHFTQDKAFKSLRSKVKNVHSIVSPKKDCYWLLTQQGDAYIVHLKQRSLQFFPVKHLGASQRYITGIEAHKGHVILTTDIALLTLTAEGKLLHNVPFTFANPNLFDPIRSWKDASPIVRRNGDFIIFDKGRVIIYQQKSKSFKIIPLPQRAMYVQPSHAFDKYGNLWFGSNGVVFTLTTDNHVALQPIKSQEGEVAKHMLIDRSDVLWIGTNGYNLRQFDLRLPRMPAKGYVHNFHKDVLHTELAVPMADINKSPMVEKNPYLTRWANDEKGRLWLSVAGPDTAKAPNICYYRNGRLITQQWRYEDDSVVNHSRFSGLAVSEQGRLWAIDARLRLIALDTLRRVAKMVCQVPVRPSKNIHVVNSLLVDGENDFYITTSLGFFHFNLSSRSVRNLSQIVPGGEFTMLAKDPINKKILWAGTKGDGLVRLDLRVQRYRIYSTNDSLPNNTIYSILPKDGRLWCSTNKGIFSFDVGRKQIQSYTSLDGLPVDEFNTFHYLRLPDGRLAFGGTQGYTLFAPETITYDSFNPPTAFTNFRVNNRDADYGTKYSPLQKAINAVDTLYLTHQENFIEFDFAALEYNIPEKLHYRYTMIGLDKRWIDAGTGNRATYTNLSSGSYIFKVNATNTAGQWSSHVKKLFIIIRPPFWQTWWFVGLMLLLTIAAAYVLFQIRVFRIRERDRKKYLLEIEVIELEAQALRAQMNPHFIFNCLSSIKSLIQDDLKQQAITYLSTFSKLIRSQLNNEQQEISLEDELKTCKLYVDMEKLRFGDKINCEFLVVNSPQIKYLMVPPLFLQPIIENAIWHGIMPLADGGEILIQIYTDGAQTVCRVQDNGIGMDESMRRKLDKNPLHQSKGISLIKDRLRVFDNRNNTNSNITILPQTEAAGGTIVEIRFTNSTD